MSHIYYTHQTENTHRKLIKRVSKVRSGAVPRLSKIVEMSHRGVLPETLSFGILPAEGFIPPQYDNKSFTELHKEYLNLSNELTYATTTTTESDSASKSSSNEPQVTDTPAPAAAAE